MFSTNLKDSWSAKGVSVVTALVLAFGMFPAAAFATGNGDTCGQETTFTLDEDSSTFLSFDNSGDRVQIDFNGGNDDKDEVIVTADTGYEVVSVEWASEQTTSTYTSVSVSNPTTTINTAGNSNTTRIDNVRVKVKKANCVDACGLQFTIEESNDYVDQRAQIAINDFSGDSDRQVVVTPKVGYQLVSIGVDYTGNDDFDATPSVGAGNVAITYNAPDNQTIDNVTVVVKTPDCVDTDADDDGVQDVNDNCPAIANANQLDSDGDNVGDVCDETPNLVTICHKAGPNWNSLPVNSNGWSGHDAHDDDFLVTAETPCPPVVVVDTDADDDGVNDDVDNCPAVANANQLDSDGDNIGDECDPLTPQQVCEADGGTWVVITCIYPPNAEDICELSGGNWIENDCLTDEQVCELEEGFWNGEDCEEIPNCEGATVYNEETNNCDPVQNQGGGGDNPYSGPTPVFEGSGSTEAASLCTDGLDNDEDGLTDWPLDTGCTYPYTNDETDPTPPAAPQGETGGLGEATEEPLAVETLSCEAPLNSYIGMGNDNEDDVKFLQSFLNNEMGSTLEVNGIFDAATIEVVKAFQLKYAEEILAPWVPFGLSADEATGKVYKTTQRMINLLSCPGTEIPMPELP